MNIVSIGQKATKEPVAKYSIGDVVELRSGGARMVVREFRPGKGKTPATVEVDWHNDSGDPIALSYVVDMVDLVLAVDEIEVKVEIEDDGA